MSESSISVIDLSAASAGLKDTAMLDIVLPGQNQPSGFRVELAGPAHPKSIALSDEVSRERIRKELEIEAKQVNGRKYKPEEDTPDERARRNVTRIVKRIVGWSPNPTFDGKTIEFSESAAVDLLLKPEMGWLLIQIADYLTNETAFMASFAKG